MKKAKEMQEQSLPLISGEDYRTLESCRCNFIYITRDRCGIQMFTDEPIFKFGEWRMVKGESSSAESFDKMFFEIKNNTCYKIQDLLDKYLKKVKET